MSHQLQLLSFWDTSPIARAIYVLGGLALLGVILLITCLPLALAESASITASTTVLGHTTVYIGATEAGGFWSEDLTDLGVNTYRLWTSMAELEWWDDDDTMDDGLWNDSRYGVPTIAQIQADSVNVFSNTIPWTWWDARFDETQAWRYGLQTRRGILEALAQNGITPVVVLRTFNNEGQPEQRPSAQWAPRPPVDDNFRNEWWEHCFAIAYWLNVRNNYGVTRFEVLNEPDYNCQGWCNNACPGFMADFCGSQAEYDQLVQDAYDAVSYANSFVGLPANVHAPVVASYNSPYVASTLDNADAAVQVVDYHDYAANVRPGIVGIRSTISAHNPDGIAEPIWNSEWGALWSSYNSLSRAMLTANQLLTFSEEGVEGVTVFNMYDWSTAAGEDYGLVDLQDDGVGGANRLYTESYYAYRLMVRGLIGGKERLGHTVSGFLGDTRTMITRDAASVYVIVLRNGIGQTSTVSVDLGALGNGSGLVTVWEYSAVNKDIVAQTPTMVNGQFSFIAPADGVSLARVGRGALMATVNNLGAAPQHASVRVTWETASELDAVGFNLYRSQSPDGARARLNDQLVLCQNPGLPLGAMYSWIDRAVQPSATYYYTLEAIDINDARACYGPVEVTLPGVDFSFVVYLPLALKP